MARPVLYKTPEQMQEVIDAYFQANTFETEHGIVKRYTMSGLANALGMARQSLCNYAQKDEFLDTVKRARAEVEECLEQHLYGNGVAGVIFNLKNNFGWKDKTEQDINVSKSVNDLTDDELAAIASRGRTNTD